MAKVLITGHSDDCVEIEGDIRDEFSSYGNWTYLHFDDGAVVKIGYDMLPDKGWHIEVLKEGSCDVTWDPADMQDGMHYTDRLHLSGDFNRVEAWGSEDGPTTDDLEQWFENWGPRRQPHERLLAAYRALTGPMPKG